MGAGFQSVLSFSWPPGVQDPPGHPAPRQGCAPGWVHSGRGGDQPGGLPTLPCLPLPRLDRLTVSWGRETLNKQNEPGNVANGPTGALLGHRLPPGVRSVGDGRPRCAPGGAGPVAAPRALPAQPPGPGSREWLCDALFPRGLPSVTKQGRPNSSHKWKHFEEVPLSAR